MLHQLTDSELDYVSGGGGKLGVSGGDEVTLLGGKIGVAGGSPTGGVGGGDNNIAGWQPPPNISTGGIYPPW